MIVKVLEAVFKNKPIKTETGEVMYEEVIDKIVVKKMEIDGITEYSELINQRTKKPYKKRCLLRSSDQWLMVNHSFDELTAMKNLQSRIIIRGFYDTSTRQGNRKADRSRKK